MNEFLEQFLIEARELVAEANGHLLALETNTADAVRRDGLFRAVHTLKGGAAIVEFPAMARALHGAEDTLSAVRAGKQALTPALIGASFAALDQTERWLDTLAATDDLPEAATSEREADAVLAGFTAPASASAAPEEGDVAERLLAEQLSIVESSGPNDPPGRMAAALRTAANVLRASGRIEDAARLDADPSTLRAIVAGETAAEAQAEVGPARTLRVDIARIDALVRLAGELGVAVGAVADIGPRHAALDRLAGELRAAVLAIRVLPLRETFRRFPRLVRNLAQGLGKPIRLVIEGEDTEADKLIVEGLFEPLLHVLRNAADHGIEATPVRAAAGKPPSGTIVLRASRDGARVIVEVDDDGAGIDGARVAERAGLTAVNDAAATELIFAPGFSTAAQVSAISGRGVGLDAVRSAVARLGGTVSVDNRPGRGLTVRFALPFTVMFTPVLTVQAAGQLFGLPLDAIRETVRVPRSRISPVGGVHAFLLRDATVPLIDLASALGQTKVMEGSEALVVIAAWGETLAGLEVAGVGGRMDVMLRPMDGLLAATPSVVGTALLGDGSVLLVLDPRRLLQ